MSHLRLVPDQAEPPKPKKPRPARGLKPDELQRLRALLRNLKRHHTYVDLAAKMGVSSAALENIVQGTSRGSLAMAVRASRVAGLSVEQLLDGGMGAADRCPTCHQPWPEKKV